MNRKTFRILTILAIFLVLVAMVACKNEVKPEVVAQIPSEDGASSAAALDANGTATIQQVFEDLNSLISNLFGKSKSVSRGEDEDPVPVANGKLDYSAPNGSVTVEKGTTLEIDEVEVAVTEAEISYSGFKGSATLTDNKLTATIDVNVTIEGVTQAYLITITDFELDEFALSVGGKTIERTAANANLLYYAQAVLFDGISNLKATFTDASIEVEDDNGGLLNIKFSGGFSVEIEGFDITGSGSPFETGEFTITSLNLDVTYTTEDDIEIAGSVDFSNFKISLGFTYDEDNEADVTTIGFSYDKLAIHVNYADVVVLNLASTDDTFSFVITNYEDEEKESEYTVSLSSKLGAGLKVNNNQVGFLASVTIEKITGTSFFGALGTEPKVKALAATVNGKYVDADSFYAVVEEIIEELSAEEEED